MNGSQFVWQDRFNTGVDIIDREHKKLFSILKRLFTYGQNEAKSQWVCQEGIKYFKEHAMKHFAEEEVYMASINYSGFDMHRRLHDTFRKKTLPEIEKELYQTRFSADAIEHFLGVCAGWLIGHTLTEDQAITGKTVSKWVGLLPEEEQDAMGKVVIQLLYDLFRLNARIISESYGGEKFGNGIYYRLVYGSPKGDRWEVFMVFEERLLVNTICDIMGFGTDKVDVMMVNATRYVAKQLVERIRVYIPSDEPYEVKEENLLTYDQFERAFAGEKPQCSLLLDTGEGYFAFCVMAPHLLQETVGSSIKPENAMKEIKKYLDENKAQDKKKILVVDDSGIVREAMKGLLGKDYEVVLASSGVSAIRCMFVDRPDLVLLDYEMPVCNGRQVLEMIRAEEELADTPVIFLTGTYDEESVRKVIALRPAGYLLKTLNPQEIRKNVDAFFRK